MKVRALAAVFGLVLCAALGAVPAVAATGSISGTVSDAASEEGIDNIWVCAFQAFPGAGVDCDFTDGDGSYALQDLQPTVYKVVFAEETSQNYLAQWYNGKAIREEAEGVAVGDGELVTGIDAALEAGGQITGRVTDIEDGEPIEEIEACASQIDAVSEFDWIHCDRTDADGEYTVQSLATGQYKVEFFSASFPREGPNYIHQYYPGRASWSEAEVRSVTAGETLAGINAAMHRGIEVSGTVTEAGGAGLTWESRVCALDAASEEIVRCDFPDLDGGYWMPGLPFGAYKISFAVDVEEEPGLILRPDGFVRQYYNDRPTFAEADVLSGAGPASFTGIDAQLARGSETGQRPRVPPVESSLPPPTWWGPGPGNPAPKRCRKGTRRKFVNGKRRCVKIQKKHRRAHKSGSRRSVAAR